MDDNNRVKAKRCCSKEYYRLVAKLDRCDFQTRAPEARHECYLKAARESGSNAKACMI